VSDSSEKREQELAEALRQLATDHQYGRLSLDAYRRLRRVVLDASESGEDIMPLLTGEIPKSKRPGIVVWIAVLGIVALLAMLAWLLR